MMWVYFIFGVLLLATITYTQKSGFRPGHSKSTALLKVMEDVRGAMDMIAPESSTEIPSSKSITTDQIIDLDPTDKKVVDMAEYTLRKYEFNAGSEYEIIDVVTATKQEDTGTIYRFNFYAKPINSPMEKRFILNCKSELWSRPWMQTMDEVTINCQKEDPVTEN